MGICLSNYFAYTLKKSFWDSYDTNKVNFLMLFVESILMYVSNSIFMCVLMFLSSSLYVRYKRMCAVIVNVKNMSFFVCLVW